MKKSNLPSKVLPEQKPKPKPGPMSTKLNKGAIDMSKPFKPMKEQMGGGRGAAPPVNIHIHLGNATLPVGASTKSLMKTAAPSKPNKRYK